MSALGGASRLNNNEEIEETCSARSYLSRHTGQDLAPASHGETGCCGFPGPVPQPLWIRYLPAWGNFSERKGKDHCRSRRKQSATVAFRSTISGSVLQLK